MELWWESGGTLIACRTRAAVRRGEELAHYIHHRLSNTITIPICQTCLSHPIAAHAAGIVPGVDDTRGIVRAARGVRGVPWQGMFFQGYVHEISALQGSSP